MTETAKKVAEAAEHRLDRLAEDVRTRFDRIVKGRFVDQVKAGRFSGQGGQGGRGAGQARSAQHRRERGGSAR